MKVIDSSALIKYIAKEEGWEKVEEHLKDGCLTLDLALKEAANALVKKMTKGEAEAGTAKEIINHLPRIVRITTQTEHLSKAAEMAMKDNMVIYDALFIALSVSTNNPLLTSDKKQAGIAEAYGVTVTLI